MHLLTVFFTCADEKEAEKITEALLNAKLVACARQVPVRSAFWWQGKIEQEEEVLVMMETVEEKFDAVERTVKQLHSYDTPVITAYSVRQTSAGVAEWVDQSFKE